MLYRAAARPIESAFASPTHRSRVWERSHRKDTSLKYLPLIWLGIWRKPGRTALILLQVAVAFALFGVLQGLKTGMDRSIADTRADFLLVTPSDFGGSPLPLAYLDRLRSLPGIKEVSFADGFLGTYQKPDQAVFALALP